MDVASTHVQEQVAVQSTCEPVDDNRAFVDSNLILYKSVHRFRAQQRLQCVDTRLLTDVQWGLVQLHRCHHVSCVSNPQPSSNRASTEVTVMSYRVRICKTCRGEPGHIELGTYSDQETAILINDAFEITEGRFNRLSLLRPVDVGSFHLLNITTLASSSTCVTLSELLAERKKILLVEDSNSSTSGTNRKRSSPVVKAELAVSRKLPRHSHSTTVIDRNNHSEDSSSEEGSDPSTVFSAPSSSSSAPLSLMSETAKTMLLMDDDEDEDDLMDTVETATPEVEAQLTPQQTFKVEVCMKRERANSTAQEQAQEEEAMQTLADLASFSQPQAQQQQQAQQQAQQQGGGGRPRSFTFSTAQEYSYGDAMQTLTWLASLDEKEVDVARSLFNLANNSVDPDDDHVINKEEDELFQLPPPPPNSLIKRGAAGGTTTPRKASFNSQSSQDSFLVEEAADRLSMLSRSAGLLASPMTRAALASPVFTSQQQKQMTTRHGPYHVNGIASSGTGRRPRSQSMSAVDDHQVVKVARSIAAAAAATANGTHNTHHHLSHGHATPSGYSNPGYDLRHTDPSSLPIMRVLHASPHLATMPRGDGYIGIYSPHERVVRVQRFLEKRKHRIWAKKVKYDVRKNFADSRVRIKGRFVKKEEEKAAMTLIQAVGGGGASSAPSSGGKQQPLKISPAASRGAGGAMMMMTNGATAASSRPHSRGQSIAAHDDEGEDDEDDDE